jgi:hypothetical protein
MGGNENEENMPFNSLDGKVTRILLVVDGYCKKKSYRRFLFYVRPAWAQSSGLKSLVCPSSGKDIAEHQGCPS